MESSESMAQAAASQVEQWNSHCPPGTLVWLPNGKLTKTRDAASICRDQQGIPVAGVMVKDFEHPLRLADCSLQTPKDLLPLQNQYSATQIKEHIQHLEHWPYIAYNLYALAKHWEYQAEKFPDHAAVYQQCAKQLRQRATWLEDDLRFVAELNRVAPNILTRLGPAPS